MKKTTIISTVFILLVSYSLQSCREYETDQLLEPTPLQKVNDKPTDKVVRMDSTSVVHELDGNDAVNLADPPPKDRGQW